MNRSKLFCVTRMVAIVVLLAGLSSAIASPVQAALGDCYKATCRVANTGTGCAFERSQGYVYVLTNAHVVGSKKNVTCTFWYRGHQSHPIAASVLRSVRNAEVDAAILVIPVKNFRGRLPSVIPLAPRKFRVKKGATLFSVGCANASWATGWQGHALGYRGQNLLFAPAPAGGRSGSAIFDETGNKIVGLLHSRGNGYGLACSIEVLDKYFGYESSEKTTAGGSCPGGVCPGTPSAPDLSRWRLLPYRYRQDKKLEQQQNPVYPSLPPVSPSPSVDLSSVEKKLDNIADLLQKNSAPMPDASVNIMDLPAAKAALEDIEVGKVERAELAEGVKGLTVVTQGLVENQTAIVKKVDLQEKSHGTLKERLVARIEKAKEDGKEGFRAIANTVVKGWLTSYGLPVGLVLLVLFVWKDVRDKVKTGDPLAIEKVVARLRERPALKRIRKRVQTRLHPDEEIVEEEELE